MKSAAKRWLWRGVKLVLALVILFYVARQFQPDLEQLDRADIHLQPGWLLASAGLYLISILPSAWFWRHLHHLFGYPLSLPAAIRANYISQLGKYVPGKALVLAIRSGLVHPHGVPYGVSIIASFYEVFTVMAAGALIAALVFLIQPPGDFAGDWNPLGIGLALIGVCGVPLLPGVFNFLVARLTARIQVVALYRLPPLRFGALIAGLLSSAAGWWVQGLSVWAMLQAVMPDPPALSWHGWAHLTAAIAFANVAGFVIVVAPGGLGVREEMLRILLSPLGPSQYIAVAVLVLRLDWIVAEAFVAACAYWIKPTRERGERVASDTP